ncbi:OmpA family protein [Paracoccus onubensis]|uniref:OmpA family protein n=1 Tax=Paracoccus onubensis TaxID=1675788 RepID=UPI002731F4CD|nr:OmpA family protein [Paracoccus onubensis]MDP0927246.1 OmpA family protein [Paracoccus onubensis]
MFTRNKDGRIRLSESEVAQKRQNNMGGLNRVLREEVQSGLDESRLTCLSGAAYPCNDGSAAITPGGVVLERQKNGRFVMAPAARQMYRVNDNGKVVRRVAEEGSAQTAIAREFARAAGIPNAAALIDGGRRGRIYEQRVTRENSRSSREDFATSLRDGWSGSNNWRDRRSDDDDHDNDLTKALVLGLGALAVGSMLNNNRQVALSTPDRVVVTRPDGSQEVIKDEVALLREPGSTVTTENFDDGSSRTIVTRADGSKIVTIRDADLRVLRRSLISPDGQSTPLIDDTMEVAPVDIAELPAPISPSPYQDGQLNEEELREALRREADIDRRFSLAQIRNIPEVRSLVAPVDIEGVTFDTGSAAIRPEQADRLAGLGNVIHETIQENPNEIFLIEGHTDTVGASATNLALSDRRAESVALALSEYYDVPPENLVVQGYGEQYPKVRSNGDIRENRRASVRRITDLLQGAE